MDEIDRKVEDFIGRARANGWRQGTVQRAESGEWYYSVEDEVGLLSVGYFSTEEEAHAALAAHPTIISSPTP